MFGLRIPAARSWTGHSSKCLLFFTQEYTVCIRHSYPLPGAEEQLVLSLEMIIPKEQTPAFTCM